MVHQQVGAGSSINGGAASCPSRSTRDRGVKEGRRGNEAKVKHPLIMFATLNISDGQAAGLWSTTRAIRLGNVNIVVVQESKFTDDDYATKNAEGYSILATATDKKICRGVSLLWRGGNLFELENGKGRGPNTVTYKVQTGEARYYVMGTYLLPSDKEEKNQDNGVNAMNKIPRGYIPILLGNLDINLGAPRNHQPQGTGGSDLHEDEGVLESISPEAWGVPPEGGR